MNGKISIYTLLCLLAINTQIHPWIDHIFDFHFDPDRVVGGNSRAPAVERDGALYESEQMYEWFKSHERDNDRDSDRGTCLDGPDRDK